MTTIPASELVSVVPSVLGVGGSALDVIGLMITSSPRVPIGTVQSFASSAAVAAFFGSGSHEAALAAVYFAGFDGSNKLPSSVLFAQYNVAAVAAYLRGGSVASLTLANLQAIAGTLIVAVDGTTQTGTIDLSTATSFSAAAALIQTAMDVTTNFTGSIDPNVGTGTIAANSVTGSISGTTMTVSAVGSGAVSPGKTVSGSGVVAGTTVVSQLTGTAGSTGTYQVSISQTVVSTTLTISGGTLTLSAVATGTFAVGQTLTGSGVTAGTTIDNLLTGTGGTGKYGVSVSQTVSSTTITASGGTLTVSAVSTGTLGVNDVVAGSGVTAGNHITALGTGTGGTGTYLVSVGDSVGSEAMTITGANLLCAYDSTSGGFTLTSGTTGGSSAIGFATGTASTALKLTSATGAVTSQGAAAAAPAAFMDGVVAITTDWVTYMTTFDPDESGNTVKQAFAAWKAAYPNRYVYVCWDTDAAPTATVPATGSLGYILDQNGDSGTALIWEDADRSIAAFICGAAASIDFEETAGRITFAYKAQAGLVASVTTQAAADNLGGNPQTSDRGNGYNFYGAYASANSSFVWFQRGFVTGPFLWLDSYIDQVWLNSLMQADLLSLLGTAKSIPYTLAGNALIEAALADAIQAGLNFGAFAPGTISAAQVTAVNTAAGANIAGTLQSQGWYLQVLPASSGARSARTTPPCKFWYLDRGAVQSFNLASVAVQ